MQKSLAHAMVQIGNQVGTKNDGNYFGYESTTWLCNWKCLEVIEAIDTLKGEGPEDLTELCLVLGSQMVVVGGKANTLEEATRNA